MDLPQDHLAQLLLGGSAHGEHEVDVAADRLHPFDEGQGCEGIRHLGERHVARAHDHQRRDTEPDGCAIDLRGEPRQHARGDERVHPLVRCGAGDVHPFRDRSDAQPRVVCQLGDDRPVDPIDAHLAAALICSAYARGRLRPYGRGGRARPPRSPGTRPPRG